MRDGTIITGDWKNIIFGDGNGSNRYKKINQIVINNRITALLEINENIISNNISLTLNNIKCSNDVQNCIRIINTNNIIDAEKENILITKPAPNVITLSALMFNVVAAIISYLDAGFDFSQLEECNVYVFRINEISYLDL